jgi:acetolactate synthase-1/2/3 large subunit
LFKQDKVKHILVRHEQAATHAADGYARSTGKPGVVLVTSGPGATNAVTGIATPTWIRSRWSCSPGRCRPRLIGNDAFQEVDMHRHHAPLRQAQFPGQAVEDLAETIKKAFYIATTGRPGPVLIDIPKDVTANAEVPLRIPEAESQDALLQAQPQGPPGPDQARPRPVARPPSAR